MANSSQARKRARQNETHRVRNHQRMSAMRTSVKKFIKNTPQTGGDTATATASFQHATTLIDRAARIGLHHRNTAARLKSKLNRRLKAMAS